VHVCVCVCMYGVNSEEVGRGTLEYFEMSCHPVIHSLTMLNILSSWMHGVVALIMPFLFQ